MGRLSKVHGINRAEFAIILSDGLQGQGLGTHLLSLLVDIGRQEGLKGIFGHILPDNYGMQRVAKKVGFTVSFDYVSGYMKAELAFPLVSFKESYIACARSWTIPNLAVQWVMRAWLMDSYKGVEELRLGEVPDPQPGPGQALLEMKFAALNPADAFLAQGMYPAKPPLPHILGRDGVGKVIAVGVGVENVKVGDTVGILRSDAGVEVWGTLADKTVIPAASLAAIPNAWSLEETAGAPLVFLTAWQALTQWSDPPSPPREGSVLLVTGASGGVGVASVLLGKSMGLVVVALSRSAEKGAKLKQLGADFVLSPETANLRKAVSTAIAPKKIDIVVDSVAGPAFNDLIAMLGYGGRISVVGRSSGTVPEFNTATLFFRRNKIGGVAVADYTPEAAQAVWKEIVRRLDALGKRPVVDRILPFDEVKAAFARLAQGPMGKVLVGIPSYAQQLAHSG